MNTVSLRKMTEAEFDGWKAYSIGEYAKDKMQALGINEAEALTLSTESFAFLAKDGIATPDNHFFMIVRDGGVLGWLWFAMKSEWGVTSAFVYDLEGRGRSWLALVRDEVRMGRDLGVRLRP